MPETDFCKRIKAVRKRLKLSQEEFAQELGVSFTTVNRWENGKTLPSKLAMARFEAFCSKKSDDEA
jgi:DNA-binding transcriptional regulator YiaG